jgi:hypothetical protein
MEINVVAPGKWRYTKVEKNGFVTYKTEKTPSNDSEELMAYEYGQAIKVSMERAMEYTFQKCKVATPPGASIEIGPFWIH